METEHTLLQSLKIFGMQNLMLEADLSSIELSGVDIGHSQTIQKDDVVDTELFEADIIASAKKMADFYILYYSLENSIRRLISGRLQERYGLDWWEEKVPQGVKVSVEKKQTREKDTQMSVRSEDPFCYTNFGELIDILNMNWSDFSDTIRSKKAMEQVLTQFNLIRNVIAHSNDLSDDEITRLKLLVKDWFRIQT